ncbi:MAG: hypothetical protein AB8G17_14460 [Gammaproteobacteria bacterium]
MQPQTFDSSPDTADAEDVFTDTSIFNAEEIVRQIEMTSAASKTKIADTRIHARRRAEMLREQKRLEAELAGLDDMDYDD